MVDHVQGFVDMQSGRGVSIQRTDRQPSSNPPTSTSMPTSIYPTKSPSDGRMHGPSIHELSLEDTDIELGVYSPLLASIDISKPAPGTSVGVSSFNSDTFGTFDGGYNDAVAASRASQSGRWYPSITRS